MSKHKKTISDLRLSYEKGSLEESNVSDDPVVQFRNWFNEALSADITESNAMTLATCGNDGQPSARIVLLKNITDIGLVFYSNYESKKGQQIAENNKGSLLFFWKELERQVRIEGRIEKISKELSTEYFQSRPKGSQIGAWSSPQSSVIERDELESRASNARNQYADVKVLPIPPFWGGYILIPNYFEFWQGRPNRLHDRISYGQNVNKHWKIKRLAP